MHHFERKDTGTHRATWTFPPLLVMSSTRMLAAFSHMSRDWKVWSCRRVVPWMV